MTLAAGKRTEVIVLQRRAAGQDSRGQESTSWVDADTPPETWAMVKPVRGQEFFAAGQMQSRADVVVNIRYRADVDSTWRLLWRDQPFEIVADPIDIDGAKTDMELMCAGGIRDGR